jgi:hypothetical protein
LPGESKQHSRPWEIHGAFTSSRCVGAPFLL